MTMATQLPTLEGYRERLKAAYRGAVYPQAKYRPIASHGGAMTAQDGVLMHVTTNHADPYNFFSHTNNGASSTWWLGETVIGKCDCPVPQDVVLVEQYYDALAKCWAQAEGNGYYQATETSGVPSTPLTAAQVHTFAHLYAWGHTHSRLQWPLQLADKPGAKGFGWHGMGGVAYGNHPGCPGTPRRNQRNLILSQARQILSPTTQPTKPTPTPVKPPVKPPVEHQPTPTHDVAPRFMGLLVHGSHGLPVEEWQARMIHRGWKTVPGHPGKPFRADGIFGDDTEAVVREFERMIVRNKWHFIDAQHHVLSTSVDGKIGMVVWHAAWDAPDLP